MAGPGIGAEGRDVPWGRTLGLHEFDGQAEEAARLISDHAQILVLTWAGQGVAPEEVHALPAVQVQQLLGVDVDGLRALAQRAQLAQCYKVDVVGAVDGLRDAEDGVRDGDAAAQVRGVLDVVDAVRGFAHVRMWTAHG